MRYGKAELLTPENMLIGINELKRRENSMKKSILLEQNNQKKGGINHEIHKEG